MLNPRGLIFFLVLLSILHFLFWNPKTENKIQKHIFEIDRAHIISLYYPNASVLLKASIQNYLGIQNVTIFLAINGSQRNLFEISLYTQYLMLSGRHDHMQLSSTAMLGCLLSHMKIWESIHPNEIVAVFEEDAFLDILSSERMYHLSLDMKDIPWDVLLLESGQKMITNGHWYHIGKYAANCSRIPCTWFGTRGYLITYRGAQQLLRHAYPISVQVDSLIALVAAFEPEFKMFWTRDNIAHQQTFHVSGIWDACFKCYMPISPLFYVSTLILICFLFVMNVFKR